MRFPKHSAAVNVGAGLAAALIAFAYFAAARAADRRLVAEEIAAIKEPRPVVVAEKDIPKGSLIKEGDVRTVKLPGVYVGREAVSREEAVVGKEASADIFAGEALSKRRLTPRRSGRASLLVAPGRVALAIGVDEVSGVAGGIRPGDRVDLFVTDQESARTRLLARKALVLGLGGLYPYAPQAERRGDAWAPEGAAGSAVVLELVPDVAQDVAEATESGKVRLALRSAR